MEAFSLVSHFILDQPRAANAFDVETAVILQNALKKAVREKKLAFVIYSAHPRIFCSGGNLKKYKQMKSKKAQISSNRTIKEILESFSKLPILVIAAVEGDCIGGGCELSLACDRIFASKNARFGFKQTSLGLIAGWGGIESLKRRQISQSTILDWLLSTRWISAKTALNEGLIDDIVLLGGAVKGACRYVGTLLAENPNLSPATIGGLKLSFGSALTEAREFEKLWGSAAHRSAVAEKLRTISSKN